MTVSQTRGVVAFSETDASGRFHFTAPMTWAEDAEHALYQRVGVEGAAFPRRTFSATFERGLVAGEEYVVELSCARVGVTSISYAWQVVGGAEVAVTGEHTVVHVDTTGRPSPIPDELRAALVGPRETASPDTQEEQHD